MLVASLPYTEEVSAKSRDGVDQALLSSGCKPLRKPGTPTIKQETNDDCLTKLWEYPAGYHASDEITQLLCKGHLTKFQLTTFKKFQLDAIRAVETKIDVIVFQKT